jgi:decaprenylphospho-beta-D-erythro-pentofuranosid-2-ulose 2-reductase
MDDAGRPTRVLLLGGTSELGQAVLSALALPESAEVVLAGRDPDGPEAAGRSLRCRVRTLAWDATDLASHDAVVAEAFAGGDVDLVLCAAGVLIPQDRLDDDPGLAGQVVLTNFAGHVTTTLAVARRMREQGHGTIVVLSSVAAVRPRRATVVYGATKAGQDAFARGLRDRLHGTGIRVVIVRPGFVIGRMTAGRPRAPLPTTPDAVGRAVARALAQGRDMVWVPGSLRVLAGLLRVVPAPIWRRIRS